MPATGKRSQRNRQELRSESAADRPDVSSPSRPAKRRKKDGSPQEVPEEESSSFLADQSATALNDDDQLLARVTQHLLAPRDQPVQASKDHANSIHEANKDGVKAYAKIAAQDWTFYVTKLAITIGRTSEPQQQQPPPPPEPEAENDEDFVHIDLGPSKLISRQHAQIYFNSREEKWFLSVRGRNGVKVDGQVMKQGYDGPLTSGEVIEVGGNEMMFVLPTELSPLNIDAAYLQRAGIAPSKTTRQAPEGRHPLPAGDRPLQPSSPRAKSARPSSSFQQPIAPAPPEYRRQATPPSARTRTLAAAGQAKSPHFEAAGSMILTSGDLDLSLDENRHVKPQYSYAQMITQAILNTSEEKLNLNGIYNFIMDNYAYYRHQQASGWQNSIRHNLSLNKAFEKVARLTDEPGKGMKWQLVPEAREDMIRTAYKGGRGGHRGSSNPSSPNQLNYITQGPKDMAAKEPASARKRRASPFDSPQPRSSLRDTQLTPVRSTNRRPLPDEASGSIGVGLDGSPLPRLRKHDDDAATTTAPAAGASAAAGAAPASPTLASSYLLQDGDGNGSGSFVTPAPHRVHPKLAPPSTSKRPSQHMPTSSPAPFWKYADIGSTPLKPPAPLELGSPTTATATAAAGARPPLAPPLPPGSSPPRGMGAATKSPVPSPSRTGRADTADTTDAAPPTLPAEADEDRGFDLTKGFQSIGSYHAPASRGLPVATAMNGTS